MDMIGRHALLNAPGNVMNGLPGIVTNQCGDLCELEFPDASTVVAHVRELEPLQPGQVVRISRHRPGFRFYAWLTLAALAVGIVAKAVL